MNVTVINILVMVGIQGRMNPVQSLNPLIPTLFDYYKNKPVFGKTKMADFSKEFAAA